MNQRGIMWHYQLIFDLQRDPHIILLYNLLKQAMQAVPFFSDHHDTTKTVFTEPKQRKTF